MTRRVTKAAEEWVTGRTGILGADSSAEQRYLASMSALVAAKAGLDSVGVVCLMDRQPVSQVMQMLPLELPLPSANLAGLAGGNALNLVKSIIPGGETPAEALMANVRGSFSLHTPKGEAALQEENKLLGNATWWDVALAALTAGYLIEKSGLKLDASTLAQVGSLAKVV